MISSIRGSALEPRPTKAVALTLSCVLALGSTGFAQTDDVLTSHSRIRDALERPAPSIGFVSAGTRVLLEGSPYETPEARLQPQGITTAQSRQASRAPSRRRAKFGALQAAGFIAGMMGGFYLGGKLGAAIEGDSCHCDDPGLLGFLAGAGIGAVGGAILGTYLTSR